MLTPAQKSTLDYHFRETNLLTNEELILELTDHYTTALEDRLTQGMTFENALTDVQLAFGGRKGLQKMERQYNRVTFRRYDKLFMNYVREQGNWPKLLVPLLIYGLTYWVTTHTPRPTSFSLNTLINSAWGGLALGSTLGLFLQFLRLWFRYSISQKKPSADAIYLLTRFLPLNLFLYAFSAALVYLAPLLPPYVYEATLSANVAMTVAYMLSYSRFYQSIVKGKPKLH